MVATDLCRATAAATNSSAHADLDIPDDLTLPQFMFEANHPSQLQHVSHHPWLIDSVSGRMVSKRELQDRIWSLSNGLSVRYNIEGDEDAVVCIVSESSIDYPVVLWSLHRLGAAVCPMNPTFKFEELVPQFREAKPRLIFVQQEALNTVHAAARSIGIPSESLILFDQVINSPPVCYPDEAFITVSELIRLGSEAKDTHRFAERTLGPGEARSKPAIFFQSSGSTGLPKLVALSHYSIISNILQVAVHDAGPENDPIPIDQRRYRPGDVACSVAPFFHIFGLVVNLHHTLFCGMTLVVIPKFSSTAYVKLVQYYSVTHLNLVPPMMVLFSKNLKTNCPEFQSVRLVTVGGAPLDNELVARFSGIVPKAIINQVYGMTETGVLTTLPLDCRIPARGIPSPGVRSASVGRAVPGVSWKVVRSDRSLASTGECGELWIKSPSLAIGYRNNMEASVNTFVDGWIRTGDEVYFDERNEIYIVQRLKDFLKVKGFQVNPAELEGHLMEHPDVLECCIVAVPDDYCGEIPKAFVVLTEEARKRLSNPTTADLNGRGGEPHLKEELAKHVADHKVQYKHLTGGIEFCKSIPKTASGKVLRRVLRDHVASPCT